MKLIRQFILLTLTLLVLVSSTGVTVARHLCGGELQNLSLFLDAEDCPMELKKQTLPPCHSSEDGPEQDPTDDCCEDSKVIFDALDHNATSKASLGVHQFDLKFIATAYAVIAHLLFPEVTPDTLYLAYASPPIVRDIPVLVQSFLL